MMLYDCGSVGIDCGRQENLDGETDDRSSACSTRDWLVLNQNLGNEPKALITYMIVHARASKQGFRR